MSRLTEISRESLNESQKKVLKAIQNGPRGEIPLTGPFAVWVKAGKLGDDICFKLRTQNHLKLKCEKFGDHTPHRC